MSDEPIKTGLEYSIPKDDDEHYTIIGRVASNWALLETMIDGAIANLANCGEQEMTCVTAQLIGPARRMDALIALFRYQGGSTELRKELKAFQGQIQQLGEDRNRVVHDPLFVKNATGEMHKTTATAKGELKYSFDPVSKEKMATVATAIREATYTFIDLRGKIDAEMNALLQERLEHIGVIPADQNPPDGSPSESAQ
jgi:hypothetical protein